MRRTKSSRVQNVFLATTPNGIGTGLPIGSGTCAWQLRPKMEQPRGEIESIPSFLERDGLSSRYNRHCKVRYKGGAACHRCEAALRQILRVGRGRAWHRR